MDLVNVWALTPVHGAFLRCIVSRLQNVGLTPSSRLTSHLGADSRIPLLLVLVLPVHGSVSTRQENSLFTKRKFMEGFPRE